MRALKSAVTATELVMKLSKSGEMVVLNLAIVNLSAAGLRRTVCQEVPVDVQSSDDIAGTLPPTLGRPDINMVRTHQEAVEKKAYTRTHRCPERTFIFF